VFLILRSLCLADLSASEKNAVGSNSSKKLFMFPRVWKLSAMLLFLAGVSGVLVRELLMFPNGSITPWHDLLGRGIRLVSRGVRQHAG
jgi:hypothetical protein